MLRLMQLLQPALILLVGFLTGMPLLEPFPAQAGQPASQLAGYPLVITPAQMQLSGDVATADNCVDATVCAWLNAAPPNSILLGVDPNSPDPADWSGGSAAAVVDLDLVEPKTRLVLNISWPNTNGKGIHSPNLNRVAAIDFDGQRVWDKRTNHRSTFMDYYAAESAPIQTTLVITQGGLHTLRFEVEPNTAWDISQITIVAYPYPQNYLGIGYSPYRDCQYPGGKEITTVAEMSADMVRLAHTTNAIRTYSSLFANQAVPGLAIAQNLAVFPGAWLDYPKATLAADDAEVAGLIDLACAYPVSGVIVGNEYYLRHRSAASLQYLHERILEVKSGILAQCGKSVAVTTAEIDDLMFEFENDGTTIKRIRPDYKAIMDDLDFAMVHIYPFWGGRSIEGAAAYAVKRSLSARETLEAVYPGQNKWVIIGETGWPSAGAPNGAAIASEPNQRKYLLELLPLVEQNAVNLLYFDAIDELWKIEEPGGVGQRWGYAYTDRSAKHDFYGIFLPPQVLPALDWPFSNAVPKIYMPLLTSGGNKILTRNNIFSEWPEGPGRFVPSGWMGDLEQIEFYGCDRSDPHSGEMAIRSSFAADGPLGWAGVYWQYPENNWGDLPDGMDLRSANKITFWARGAAGGEKIRFFSGGIGTGSDPYPDSLSPQVSTGFITLTEQWKEYSLNLLGKDLSHVVGGFGWATDRCANPGGATFFLDDINFVYDPDLQPVPPHGATFDVYSDAAAEQNHYAPSGWMADAAVPGRATLSECAADNPHSGASSIRIAYTQEVIGWAGFYWVDPAENWGEQPGGFDLRGAARISFWARSETPATSVKIVIGGVGYPTDPAGNAICSPNKPYPDLVCPNIVEYRTLSMAWQKYTLTLPQGRNLARVVGGFGVVLEQPATIYLDDIVYEFGP